jgi:endonuclease-3
MGTAKATRAADKSQVCRRLVQALQKLYGKSVPSFQASVLDTMLFAVCLEDNRWEQAESGLKLLISSFFDLNEIRVSSVTELERALDGLAHSDLKGMRIRAILRHVFEGTYTFEFEKLRRMTLEQAIKALKKIQELSPFVRDFVLHEILGNHVVYLDGSMLTAARWLGLVPATADVGDASEYLKAGVRKSEVSEFCHLLKCLSTDVQFAGHLSDPLDGEYDMADVLDRLTELQSPRKKVSRAVVEVVKPERSDKAEKSSAKKPAAARSAAAKPAAAKPAAAAVSPSKPAARAATPAAREKGKSGASAAASSGKKTAGGGSGSAAAKGAAASGKSASSKSASPKSRR